MLQPKILSGWSIGLHGKNRKYFHYYFQNKWLCGTTRIALPTQSAFNLGLSALHDEIDENSKCKRCKKLLEIQKI